MEGLSCSETMQCPDGQSCNLDTLTCDGVAPVTAKLAQIVAGDTHTCGIDPAGTLYCWGNNDQGQLGVGDTDLRNVPTRVGTESDWTAVAAGAAATCGLRADHSLWCWGDRLVVGTASNAPVQVTTPASAGGWTAVALSTNTMCAIDASGGTWCLYYDTDPPQLRRLPEAPAHAVAIGVGASRQCVIDDQQHLACWGFNGTGGVGNGTNGTDPVTVPYQQPGTWKSLGVGSYTTCAIDSNSHLWCWGDCDQNQASPDDATGSGYCVSPTQIGPELYTSVSAGGGFTCAVRQDHAMICLGRNLEGELGASTISQRNPPVEVGSSTDWASVTAGGGHTCAIRTDGAAWCWGADRFGQLGDNRPTTFQQVPVEVSAGPWAQVSAGLAFTCGLHTDHTLWCWGENGAGQLGDNTTTRRTAPVQIGTDADWTKISAGGSHTCGLRAGALWCWGDNRDGQLGRGSVVDVTEHLPRQVGTAVDWVDVAAGNVDTLAVRSSMGLYYWGDYQRQASPLPVDPAKNWASLSGHGRSASVVGGMTALSADTGSVETAAVGALTIENPTYTTSPNWSVVARGFGHWCGISAAIGGGLLCWGDNTYGELGTTANLPNDHTAVPVDGGRDWKAVDASNYATCAITASGAVPPDELFCWGRADLVPLAIANDAISTPQRIASGVQWSSLSISDHHGCAIRMDGSLWCWGDNLAGELGVGPTAQHQPVRVQMVAP